MPSSEFKAGVKRLRQALNRDYEKKTPSPTAGGIGTGKIYISGQIYDGTVDGATTVVNIGRPAAASYAPKNASSTVVRAGGSTGGSGGGVSGDYLKLDGSTAMLGDLNMNGYSVVNPGNVDGVDVSVFKSNYDAHILNPDAHHNRAHDMLSTSDHTYSGGASLDIFGLSASSTLGLLTPSSAPGAASAILKSSAAGDLTLPTFTATTRVSAPEILLSKAVATSTYKAQIFLQDTGTAADSSTGIDWRNTTHTWDMGRIAVVRAGSAANFHMAFSTSTSGILSEKARILNNGNILVATTTDSGYKLDVNGTARVATSVTTPLITTVGAGVDLTVASADDILLDPASNIVKLTPDVVVQSDNYASQLTGMRVTYDGQGDFRYLYTDELHAKAFIADLEQALAGGQIICKSVSILHQDFTAPAAGGTAQLVMRDLPSATGMAVFVDGDYVRIRTFSRAGGGLSITDCWGTVVLDTSYGTSGFNSADKSQRYTFTRSTAPNAGAMSAGTVVEADAIILDYGTSGNGFYEVNAIDGLYAANSPYFQVVTWAGHPRSQTVRLRGGNLYGIFAQANEYGLYAGAGVTDSDQYLRMSNIAVRLNNVPLRLHNSGVQTVNIDSAGTNIWVGPNSTDKRLYWNGALLSVKGAIEITAASSFSGSGYLQVGSGTKGSTLNGFNMNSSEFVGQASGVDQVVMDTDGIIKAGAGAVWLDVNGVNLAVEPVSTTPSYLRFMNGGSLKGSIGYFYTAGPIPDPADGMNFYADTGNKFRFLNATSTEFAQTVNVTGSVTATVGMSVGGTAVSLATHNHNSTYLALTGGTLTGTVITDVIRPAANNTDTVGDASYYYNAGYFNNLYVNAIVGTPSYSHTHAATDITSGTLNDARLPTTMSGKTFSGAVILDADSGGNTQNYVRWLTDVSGNKFWGLVGRAHDYPTTPSQQNDLVLEFYNGSSYGNVFVADNATRVIDFAQTPTVGGTTISLSTHNHDSSYASLSAYNAHVANANAHHNQSHVLATTSALGADHTVSGLTTGQVLRATGATTAQFMGLTSGDITTALGYTPVPSTRQVIAGAGLSGGGNLGADVTISLTTPDSLSATSTNSASGNHTHAVTASSAPGAAESILKSSSAGNLTLPTFTASTKVTTSLVDTASGALALRSAANTFSLQVSDGTTRGSFVVGATTWDINPLPDASADSAFRYFRNTNTTGAKNIYFFKGDNTATIVHAIGINGTTRFNVAGDDIDFSVRGDTDNNLFYVDASADSIGIGTSSPAYKLDVSGTLRATTSIVTPIITSGSTLTLSPTTDLVLAPASNLVKLSPSTALQSDNYASQTTGWQMTYGGGLDARSIYTDELHAKAFIADLEQALAGLQIISKSVAILAEDFVAPYAGGQQRLVVDDLPSAANMAVFQANDYVLLRSFNRSGGSLSIGNCWGQVTSYTDGTGTQTWTLTRSGTTTYNTIAIRGTAQSNAAAAATSTTVTKPTGVVSGDFLLAIVTHDGTADTITASGWTLAAPYVSGSDINGALYYKVAGGSEPANYTFSTIASHAIAAAIVAYTNVVTAQPFDGTPILQANASSTNMATANAWASSTSGRVAFLGGITNNTSATPPSGMVELIDAGATGIRVYAADELLSASGQVSRTATIASAFASVAATVVLRPTYSAMSSEAGGIVPGTTITADSIVLDFGVSGNGYYEVNAIDGTYGANSPYTQIVTWTTHPATGKAVRSRWGNLNGVSIADYGLVMGTDVSSSTTRTFDFRSSTGNLALGINGGAVKFDGNGNSYFAGVMTIDTAGEIRQGTNWGSNFTGLRIWNDGGIGRIAGYSGNNFQWYAGTNGKLYAGGGSVEIDSTGIAIYYSGTPRLKLSPTDASLALGPTVPTFTSGDGVWMGIHGGNVKMRIGTTAGERLVWDGTNLNVYGAIQVTAASSFSGSGYLQVGSGTKDSTLNGFNINSSEFVGQTSGVDQIVLGSDGKFKAGAGNVILDANGVSVIGGSAFRLMENSSTLKGHVYSSNPLDSLLVSSTGVGVKTVGSAAAESVSLRANSSSGRSSEIAIEATNNGSTNRIRALVYAGATASQMLLGESSFQLSIGSTGSTDFSIDASGNTTIAGDLDLSASDLTDVSDIFVNTGGNIFIGGPTTSSVDGVRFHFSSNAYIDVRTGALIFRADTSTGGTERMRMTNGGNFGIGLTPSYKLDVNGTAHASAFDTSSDERFKDNLRPILDVLDKLSSINGYTYHWKPCYIGYEQFLDEKNNPRMQIGFSAQEVFRHFPELISRWRHVGNDGVVTNDAYSMDYSKMVPILVTGMRELRHEKNAQVQQLETRIAQLEAEVTDLRGRFN